MEGDTALNIQLDSPVKIWAEKMHAYNVATCFYNELLNKGHMRTSAAELTAAFHNQVVGKGPTQWWKDELWLCTGCIEIRI